MIFKKTKKRNNGQVLRQDSGQVMMIVIMVLSGVMIGSMAISGTLTARQIRQSADAGASSKVIFAADAGLEWVLYKFVKDKYECIDCPNGEVCDQLPEFKTSNGVEVTLNINCEPTGFDEFNNYYKISSTGSTDKSSYTFSEVFFIRK
jgi:hypothetical protein